MDKPLFKLQIYEGPLDLLLELIRNSKVDILDIPIATILEQYLLYLQTMDEMNMEVTAEFLTMASQLLLIKSKMLLPKEKEEEDDPRMELAQALLLYEHCKVCAQELVRLKEQTGERFTKLPDVIDMPKVYKEKMPLASLVRAYTNVLEKNRRRMPPKVNSFVRIVGREIFPVKQKVRQLLDWFKKRKRLDFHFLFTGAKSRSEMVATFLAVLEMAKEKKITITEGEDLNYTIEVKQKAWDEA